LILVKLFAVPEDYLVALFVRSFGDFPIRQVVLFDQLVKRRRELLFYLRRIRILRDVENLAKLVIAFLENPLLTDA
jgi:hypothetical protein